ncbi:uncharacterized protein PHACADRAFT_265492 [Phanerochaete carnosa HHB-10118-sp]|uniref:Uncharacterized protein n=1 Tax=Phanerochaete carnosa (strain HHB-10118-sp) TaxID=650164 RepID=K5VSS6_PHACS|nr:uncharacterized protein PHACADRAFT_265492 [Phanerochaete carnosa HHB-10118-sp]EKM49795.1 hypothetical protein PHACADRAFT_265492 [Phanerochaete carnosa HHB-10118-sp]
MQALYRTSSWPFRTPRHNDPLPSYSSREDAPCAQAGSRAAPTGNGQPPMYTPRIIALAPVPPAYHPGEPSLGPPL